MKVGDTIKRWVREIHKVGIVDWVWFVIWLRRDEFSEKLDIFKYYPDMEKLMRDRDRAHRIDLELENIK